VILNSSTYQLSSMPRASAPQAEANFASYPLRRLDAEVLIDAINKITGTSDLYTSPIPEPFTYIPADKPAIAIADGSITSPFLTLFGRSARATGMENERNNRPVPAQWLFMLNSSQIQRKIDQGPKLKAVFESGRKPEEILEDLYLTILSRQPTAEEKQSALEYGRPAFVAKPPGAGKAGAAGKAPAVNKTGAAGKPLVAGKAGTANKPGAANKPDVAKKPGVTSKPGDAKKPEAAGKPAVAGNAKKAVPTKRHDDWVDIAWALINSTEFLYRH
jgi:hypothetical protein